MITKDDYLSAPCRASSIPYWKAKSLSIPSGMLIVLDEEYEKTKYHEYTDEPYFRLIHDLQNLSAPILPEGYSLSEATLGEFAEHINSCYESIGISESELKTCAARPVYHPSLWISVKDDQTGSIAATGIAEIDRDVGEGILEWIQVSKNARGKGLGRYIVSELLWRMKDAALFVTVSGQCNNPAKPEKLYRRCGFTGSDVWHILRKKIMGTLIHC